MKGCHVDGNKQPSLQAAPAHLVLSPCAGGSALELLLGPDGEYIREIVIDELAKGIDAGARSGFDSFVVSARSRLLRAFRVSHGASLAKNVFCTRCQVCVCYRGAFVTLCGIYCVTVECYLSHH